MDNALVSLIITVYNGEQYLPRALDSVVEQTYKCLEIILVDDGSTDRSGEICDDYADRDKRIRVLHQQNAGVSVARNLGLTLATGEFLGFVDADDKLAQDSVATLVQHIAGYDMVVCGYYYIDGEGKMFARHLENDCVLETRELLQRYLDDEIIFSHGLEVRPLIGGYLWNKLFRRKIWGDIQFLPARHVADSLAVTDYVSRISIINCITNCLYYYYFMADGITYKPKSKTHIDDLIVIRYRQRALLQKFLQRQDILDNTLLAKSNLLLFLSYMNLFFFLLLTGQEKATICAEYLHDYQREFYKHFACLRFCKNWHMPLKMSICCFNPGLYFKIVHLKWDLS